MGFMPRIAALRYIIPDACDDHRGGIWIECAPCPGAPKDGMESCYMFFT
ncbi:hypothetical protein D3OALGA1CA_1005 [Olavius algarvensis associated proteobacterium Delta 3]|nr:hypothetical protein D3OALGA1CA_1005 [Olavius algarvensis associated proteobacterium Delta 3]